MKINWSWKRSYLVDEPDETKGGGGGGGEKKEEIKEEKVEPDPRDQEIEKLKAENESHKKFRDLASPHVDYDETAGTIKPKIIAPPEKVVQPTQEELDRQQLKDEVITESVRLSDLNRKTEEEVINHYKTEDPLFAKNFLIAKEKIAGVPPSQRTRILWDRAMSMASGENKKDMAAHYIEVGRQQMLKELGNVDGITLPKGSGGGSDGGTKDGKPDISKIVLSRAELKAARQMVESGMLKSIDEYKENKVLLVGQDGEDE